MKIGTNISIGGFRLDEGIELDMENIPVYHYSRIIPEKYRRDDTLHDIAVASILLYSHDYMTEWQLEKVCDWVKKQNRIKLFNALRTCRAIRKENKDV